MALRWDHLLVLALVGCKLCEATASKRGNDEDEDFSSDSTQDSSPEEQRYQAPDMYKPSGSLVERAVHRVEQNLERVMKADLKKIEKRVMDKVSKVQSKQMRRLREMQETETIRQKADALPQGASELENDLEPSDEEVADDSGVADARKNALAGTLNEDVPPSSLAAKGESEEDDEVGSDGFTNKQRNENEAVHAAWRVKDHEEDDENEDEVAADEAKANDKDEVSASLEEVASALDEKAEKPLKRHNHHSEAFKQHLEASKHKKRSIEVDSEGDGMMRRE